MSKGTEVIGEELPEKENPEILLIYGNTAPWEKIRRRLDAAGWRVVSATSPVEISSCLSEGSFDVIVADIEIPAVEPMVLLSQLKFSRNSTPVLVVSDSFHAPNVRDLYSAGAAKLILAPYTIEEVWRAIEELVLQHHEVLPEYDIYEFLARESSSFTLTTRQLASAYPTLPIAHRLFRIGKISGQTHTRLLLAFQEAVSNSVDHGNLELDSAWREEVDLEGIDRFQLVRKARLNDPHYSSRQIRVSTDFDGSVLTIGIEDDGCGFATTPDSTSREGVEDPIQCYGRGITLIRSVMDEVAYSRGGRRVIMKKRLC